jgi:hypothetical protein
MIGWVEWYTLIYEQKCSLGQQGRWAVCVDQSVFASLRGLASSTGMRRIWCQMEHKGRDGFKELVAMQILPLRRLGTAHPE